MERKKKKYSAVQVGKTDTVAESRGSECSGLECFLDIVRALGMGSCLSLDGGSPLSYTSSTSGIHVGKRQKKSGTGNSTCDPEIDMQLYRVPGRLFLNGSSNVASLFSKRGKKGINQDAMIVWENFGLMEDTIFCGVFDGHGPYGHMVAKKVRDALPLKLRSQWGLRTCSKDCFSKTGNGSLDNKNSEDIASLCFHEEQGTSVNYQHKFTNTDTLTMLKESIFKAFKFMDKDLKLHPTIDSFCSGTTAVILVKEGEYLVIGNVGDSRAVLGTRGNDNRLKAVQLTVDLKPTLPKEAERISLCRGRIFAHPNEPGIARVWLPNSDIPGLAMARALGDFCLKDFGLISVPEVSYHRLTEKDEFVVLASDGVWDVLSNKEVVDIVASAPRPSAARSIVDAAAHTWKLRYPSARTDDCAVVCLFLNSSSSSDMSVASSEPKGVSWNQNGLKNLKAASSGQAELHDSGTVNTLKELTSKFPFGN